MKGVDMKEVVFEASIHIRKTISCESINDDALRRMEHYLNNKCHNDFSDCEFRSYELVNVQFKE